jgi:hypothetical protein
MSVQSDPRAGLDPAMREVLAIALSRQAAAVRHRSADYLYRLSLALTVWARTPLPRGEAILAAPGPDAPTPPFRSGAAALTRLGLTKQELDVRWEGLKARNGDFARLADDVLDSRGSVATRVQAARKFMGALCDMRDEGVHPELLDKWIKLPKAGRIKAKPANTDRSAPPLTTLRLVWQRLDRRIEDRFGPAEIAPQVLRRNPVWLRNQGGIVLLRNRVMLILTVVLGMRREVLSLLDVGATPASAAVLTASSMPPSASSPTRAPRSTGGGSCRLEPSFALRLTSRMSRRFSGARSSPTSRF